MKHGIMPEGEALRNAVRWLAHDGDYSLAAIEVAARRFDLSPAEEDFLIRHFLHADQAVRPAHD